MEISSQDIVEDTIVEIVEKVTEVTTVNKLPQITDIQHNEEKWMEESTDSTKVTRDLLDLKKEYKLLSTNHDQTTTELSEIKDDFNNLSNKYEVLKIEFASLQNNFKTQKVVSDNNEKSLHAALNDARNSYRMVASEKEKLMEENITYSKLLKQMTSRIEKLEKETENNDERGSDFIQIDDDENGGQDLQSNSRPPAGRAAEGLHHRPPGHQHDCAADESQGKEGHSNDADGHCQMFR